MIEASRIGEALGGPRVLKRPVASILDLSEAVEHGLPKTSLRCVARRVSTNPAQQLRIMRRIVPKASYERRRERLSPAESERTERMAWVVAMAEYVWEDRAQARRFLNTPHAELGGQSPIDAAHSELGARQAEEVMARILYGLPV